MSKSHSTVADGALDEPSQDEVQRLLKQNAGQQSQQASNHE